jgi:GNAT superfamily N-acetyltransferase
VRYRSLRVTLAKVNGLDSPVTRTPHTTSPTPPVGSTRVKLHTGDRESLRSLLELAEDSRAQLDAYIDAGRVLVAIRDDVVVGHLQLVDTEQPGVSEIKNMAVTPSRQRHGIGRGLVTAALELARREGAAMLQVATATADVGNLRFYQRMGFRIREIERDAFTAATGYPPGIHMDGIELRDRVWLDRPLGR